MLRFLAHLRFRTKVILAIAATFLLVIAVFLGFNYFEYYRTASLPLTRFIPDSAHAAAVLADFAKKWKDVFQSPALELMVPALRGKESLGECIAAVMDDAGGSLKSYSGDVRKAVARLGEERVLSLCGRETFVAVEFRPGGAAPFVVIGARVGFTDFLGRIALGSVLEEVTNDKVRSIVIAGSTFWQVNIGRKKEREEPMEWLVGFIGGVALASNKESFLRRSITAGLTAERAAPGGTARPLEKKASQTAVARVALNFADAPDDCGWRTETVSFLKSVPIREVLHFLKTSALRLVTAELQFSKGMCRILLDVGLQPDILDRRQISFLTEPDRGPLESPALVPERAFLCVASMFTPADSWDFLVGTARERDRASCPRQVGDILKAIYAEADRILLTPLEKAGKHTELLSALGGEALIAASREQVAATGEERISIGGSAIVRARDERKVLSILDGLEAWNVTDSQGRPQLAKETHRGVDVRLLKLAFQKYGRGFTPSYAVVNGWLVFSSSLSFVHDVIDLVMDGPGGTSANLIRHDTISGERASYGNMCALVDFRSLRDTLQEARSAIAEVQSDNVDRVAVRAEVVEREETALESAGQNQLVAEWRRYRDALSSGSYVAPSQALQQMLAKVDTLVMEEVENARRRAEQVVLDFTRRLGPMKALSMSVKSRADGFTLTLTVTGKPPGKRN
jgi:hypothetical protein